jgi:hypothetical protein
MFTIHKSINKYHLQATSESYSSSTGQRALLFFKCKSSQHTELMLNYKHTNFVDFSPQPNYADWATPAAGEVVSTLILNYI